MAQDNEGQINWCRGGWASCRDCMGRNDCQSPNLELRSARKEYVRPKDRINEVTEDQYSFKKRKKR